MNLLLHADVIAIFEQKGNKRNVSLNKQNALITYINYARTLSSSSIDDEQKIENESWVEQYFDTYDLKLMKCNLWLRHRSSTDWTLRLVNKNDNETLSIIDIYDFDTICEILPIVLGDSTFVNDPDPIDFCSRQIAVYTVHRIRDNDITFDASEMESNRFYVTISFKSSGDILQWCADSFESAHLKITAYLSIYKNMDIMRLLNPNFNHNYIHLNDKRPVWAQELDYLSESENGDDSNEEEIKEGEEEKDKCFIDSLEW